MWRAIRTGILCASFVVALPAISFAGKPIDPPTPAPIPEQILKAKTVFISNWGSTVDPTNDVPIDLPYNEFYGYMQSWGKYELKPAPAEADLVVEIRFEAPISIYDRQSYERPALRLVIVDPKTHTVLWAFTQSISAWESGPRKNFDNAMLALVDQLRIKVGAPSLKPEPQPDTKMHLF